MKLQDLILRFPMWEIVEKNFIALYPEEENDILSYKKAFFELSLFIEPVEAEGWSLHIRTVDDEDGSYADVYQMKENDDTAYGVDFEPWANILGTEIAPETFEKFTMIDVLCHVLYEIIFYGWSSKEVEEEGERIRKIKETAMREFDANEYIRIYKEGLDRLNKA